MRRSKILSILSTARQAYALHARAIRPPVVFLVTAEFLYHRVVGNAEGPMDKWHAIMGAPWYMPAATVAAWLAGLQSLLSFSISRQRHLLLGERFDPFFFKAPFWRYLGFLLLTYAWIVPVVLLSARTAIPFTWHWGSRRSGRRCCSCISRSAPRSEPSGLWRAPAGARTAPGDGNRRRGCRLPLNKVQGLSTWRSFVSSGISA